MNRHSTRALDGRPSAQRSAIRRLPRWGLAALVLGLAQSGASALQEYHVLSLDKTGSMNAIRSATGNTRFEDSIQQAKLDVATIFANDPTAFVSIWKVDCSGSYQVSGFSNSQTFVQSQVMLVESMGPGGATAMADGICAAADWLDATAPAGTPYWRKFLWIYSDGGENCSSDPACAGPYSTSGTQCGPLGNPNTYDPGSWQFKVCARINAKQVVKVYFWDNFAASGPVSDEVFFRSLAEANHGTYSAVNDNDVSYPAPTAWPAMPLAFVPAAGYFEDFESHQGTVPLHFGLNRLDSDSKLPHDSGWANIGNDAPCQFPSSGQFDLEMGGAPGAPVGDVTNGLVLGLDGSCAGPLTLGFRAYRVSGESPHPEDGVFISSDGATWTQVYGSWSSIALPFQWTSVTGIDLSSSGVSTDGPFFLRFSQRDTGTFGLPFAGVAIDDISVDGPGCGGLVKSGTACSQFGSPPDICGCGTPRIGTSDFTCTLSGAGAGLPAILYYGTSASSWLGTPLPVDLGAFGFPGCTLYHDLAGVAGSTLTSASGSASVPLDIPAAPALIGFPLRLQWLLLDPIGSGQIAMSDLGTVPIVQ